MCYVGETFTDEKIKVAREEENGSLLKQLLEAKAVLQLHDVREPSEFQEQDESSSTSTKLKCTQCGGDCSSWNECCEPCRCVLNSCLYLPNRGIMLNAE